MASLQAQFAARPAWVRCVGLIVLGGVAGLGQAPIDQWPATIVALAVLLALLSEIETPKRAAFYAWLFGVGYFAFSLRWIVEPFLVDIARHGWMAPFALALMASGAALFWAIAAGLARRLVPGSMLFTGLALVVAEMTRSLILSGFPWALLGHIWVTTSVAQIAAFGGPHLLTLLTVLGAWGLALLARPARLVGVIVLGLLLVLAFVLRPGPPPGPTDDLPVVRLVQPNAPQHQK
ncbi:MAG: apolipoprotein N-acyltransferase, partial [Pseudomonadota bacterium]